MPLACSQCRRINPADAAYCYHDGTPLPGSRAAAAPLHLGSQAFLREFVFPNGRCCRNFDELALACAQDRGAAVELLQGGYVESFLGGIGRTDLAAFAKQTAQMNDRQRGLEALLERFPTQALEPARLQVEPLQINLGQLAVGRDQQFVIHVVNHGLRLLQGTIVVDETPWLSLSQGAALTEKSFTVDHELELRVFVLGKRLKASKKTQSGKLLIDTNGGVAEVVVSADVPIQPFPNGILAGAQTQRQLAEMAFKQAKEAAIHFERGEVAKWYAANGWQYPVQAPTASGLASLQQFLEACGLTQAPKVEMDTSPIRLRGAVGERLESAVRVKAVEKKPAFAYAWSDRNWLVPRPAQLKGTLATIPIDVPKVPDVALGTVLTGKLTVVANGRQRFIIPVQLAVQDRQAVRPEPLEVLPAAPVSAPSRRRHERLSSIAAEAAGDGAGPWLHLLPAVLLMGILSILILVDALRPRQTVEPTSFDVTTGEPLDNEAYVDVCFNDTSYHKFGIVLPIAAGEKRKKLTFDEFGRTNNTVVRINDRDFIFGPEGNVSREHSNPLLPNVYNRGRGWKSQVDFQTRQSDIRVVQDVSLRRVDQTGKLATCLIRYTVTNHGQSPQRVGLRFMLDTFIGDNDGVPFTIPGRDGLCDTMLEFGGGDKIPDFIQALERPDLQDPGTVAHLTLKIHDPQGKLEMPSRVLLTSWPNSILGLHGALGGNTRWNVPMSPIKLTPPRGDSCVVIYWNEVEMRPGQSREMACAYGVGQVTSTAGQGSGQLALTIDGTFRPGGEFLVTAYVNNPEPDQKVAIELADGLRLVEPTEPVRVLRAQTTGTIAPATWRVRADRQGEFNVVVRSGKYSQGQKVRIREKSFLD